jgi:hypothetical protein
MDSNSCIAVKWLLTEDIICGPWSLKFSSYFLIMICVTGKYSACCLNSRCELTDLFHENNCAPLPSGDLVTTSRCGWCIISNIWEHPQLCVASDELLPSSTISETLPFVNIYSYVWKGLHLTDRSAFLDDHREGEGLFLKLPLEYGNYMTESKRNYSRIYLWHILHCYVSQNIKFMLHLITVPHPGFFIGGSAARILCLLPELDSDVCSLRILFRL